MTTILTRYIGPTDTKPARIAADAGAGRRVVISYGNISTNPHREAAIALCRKMDWHGQLIQGGLEKGGSAFVFFDERDAFTV